MMNEIRAARKRAEYLLEDPNVVGVGVGLKQVGGHAVDDLSVVISVVNKGRFHVKDRIPRAFGGWPTDVVQTGKLYAWQAPTEKWRPAPGGVSIGHINITAGTLGCVVERDGVQYILSNNHVLAMSNDGVPGDPILQPGSADDGTPEDQIATLEEFVPINFGELPPECNMAKGAAKALNVIAGLLGSGHRVKAYQENGVNWVDAAIARPLSPDLVESRILEIGVPKGSREAALGTDLKKSGRTSGLTTGRITQVDATLMVNYGGIKVAVFNDQFVASEMGAPGDSGSAVLDEEDYVVGLLFAGGEGTTVINPIQFVLDALRVTIATG